MKSKEKKREMVGHPSVDWLCALLPGLADHKVWTRRKRRRRSWWMEQEEERGWRQRMEEVC